MKSFATFFLFFFTINLWGEASSNLKAQPEILFDYKKFKDSQQESAAQLEFNKAVVLLRDKKYQQAIEIFKITAKVYKFPSYLNIGISFYKLDSNKNAKLYFDKIFTNGDASYQDLYSYLSSCFYLYKITNDEKYLNQLTKIARKSKKIDDLSKMLLVDAHISLKDYKNAYDILSKMPNADNLKMAILAFRLQDFEKAGIYLKKATETTYDRNIQDKVFWLNVYYDLKTNNLTKLGEDLQNIEKYKRGFRAHIDYPIKLAFNKRKYSTKEYFEKISKFDFERKVDFLFYFSPFILSDNDEIYYDSARGFIDSNKNNLTALNKMVNYNQNLVKIIKKDPIERTFYLQQLAKEDSKSYIYYNLALSYAQIEDFQKAHFYFKKAFKLNPGNKIYAAMTLISAKRANAILREREYISDILKTNKGLYAYHGQRLYQFFLKSDFKLTIKKDDPKFKNTLYARALDFLIKMPKKGLDKESELLRYHQKDPFVYLMNFMAKNKNESNYDYVTRIQDKMPLKLNDNFISAPLIVTKYYFDMVKSVGLFDKADLVITGSNEQSYLRTRAYTQLHKGYPNDSIKILEYLQKRYNLEDTYTMYLQVAALLEAKRYNDANMQITLLRGIVDDGSADFLIGVALLNELKTSGLMQYFKEPYKDSLIDFEIENVDSLLENL